MLKPEKYPVPKKPTSGPRKSNVLLSGTSAKTGVRMVAAMR